jgi:hypothetical protein
MSLVACCFLLVTLFIASAGLLFKRTIFLLLGSALHLLAVVFEVSE